MKTACSSGKNGAQNFINTNEAPRLDAKEQGKEPVTGYRLIGSNCRLA